VAVSGRFENRQETESTKDLSLYALNGQGKLEFLFAVPDDAAFFLLEAR
jgi:hypothetical protein